MSIARAQINYGGNLLQPQAVGERLLEQASIDTNTTAGSATLSVLSLIKGILRRTGPGAGFTDTFPTADSLLAADPDLNVGDSFDFTYINGVAQAMTAAAGEGVVLGSNVNVAASLVRRYLITVLGIGPRQNFIGTMVNGTPIISGVPTAVVAACQPGQGLSGTSIAAGAYIVAVNSATGLITMSANATGSTTNAVTTFPRYQLDGISSHTA